MGRRVVQYLVSAIMLHKIESWHPHEVSLIGHCFVNMQYTCQITGCSGNKHTSPAAFTVVAEIQSTNLLDPTIPEGSLDDGKITHE